MVGLKMVWKLLLFLPSAKERSFFVAVNVFSATVSTTSASIEDSSTPRGPRSVNSPLFLPLPFLQFILPSSSFPFHLSSSLFP
ncbi:uncharacterized protein ASPGLDRAFT_361264 [Aspergillus glaucus CBS 516.65]|uniref:Secreted protein n=1 Tax=Aspergillus glaucus CBS 516.65 TaxID=1160497 RepID=A0A1L9VJ14_ASPGL|nr:hypothetical protein ASPGLDRAFT_361264 [Aspergillus glaucus CBS 516.65]OJJ83921.1 hypothetical protein ASPGLDRAFT_361264 [Aspergillus glaucus CBS 516.65]